MKTESGSTKAFEDVTRLRRWCILLPLPFIIVVDFVARKTTEAAHFGMQWKGDKILFDLEFADNIANMTKETQKRFIIFRPTLLFGTRQRQQDV